MILQTAITGILIGGVLALPVMGVALIYGVTGILNYAIAAIGTFSVFVTWTLLSHGLWVGILAGLAVSFAIGFGIQRFLLNPLIERKGYDLTLFFIITFGIATIVSSLTKNLFPRPTISIELPRIGILSIAGATVDVNRLIAIGIALGILLLIRFLQKTTKTGRSWSATSQNLKMAKLVGINVGFVYALVSGIGVILGFIGAFYWGALYNLTVNTGWDLTFLGYIIAIVGGIGNVWGGMLSALIMGEVIAFAGNLVGGIWQSVVLYGILFAILVFAPKGILGSERSV
jgi:branched-chain amino acid transport system permease protein